MAKQSKKDKLKKGGKKSVKTAHPLKSYPGWFSNQKLHIGLLFAIGFLLYANTFTHDYTLDDAIVITNNMYVEDGLSGIPGILSKDTFYGFFKEEGKAQLVAGGRYRPLTLIMFAVEVQLFGQRPVVGHLFNALYYGLTVVVLYLLMLQLFRPQKNAPKAYFIALATALLFAVHPLHTEVVANIKGRDEIIALLGSIAALYFSIRAMREKNMRFQILAGGLFFLGLMAKENAITFLAVVPLAYYFFTKAEPGTIVKQSLPFVAGAIVFLLIRFSILGSGLSEPTMEMMNNPFVKVEGNRYLAFTFTERMATIFYGLGKYLQLLIAPVTLSHDYYPRQIGVMQFSDWRVLLSLLAYIGMGVYALMGFRKKDPVSFGILYFLATLSIVSNIVFPVGTHIAERLLFMPSVGFAMVLAILGYRLASRSVAAGKAPAYRHFSMVLVILAVVGLVYAGRTIARNPVWKDNFTLFLNDVENSPNSAKLRNAAGGELVTQSVNEQNAEKRNQMLREAIGHLKEATRIHPNYKNAYLLLGNAYNYLQEFDQSIESFQKALNIDPAYRDAKRNLGITYKDAGKFYGETRGELDKAIQYLNQAYSLLPKEYEVLRLLGVAHGVKGNGYEAVEYFTLASEINPNDPQAWLNLGTAQMAIGNTDLGMQFREKAFQMEPALRAKMNPQTQGQ
jgi:tetratricopeptide (TPR) repeat protein